MPASSPSRRNYPEQMIARLKEMEAPERPKLCGPEYTAWQSKSKPHGNTSPWKRTARAIEAKARRRVS